MTIEEIKQLIKESTAEIQTKISEAVADGDIESITRMEAELSVIQDALSKLELI